MQAGGEGEGREKGKESKDRVKERTKNRKKNVQLVWILSATVLPISEDNNTLTSSSGLLMIGICTASHCYFKTVAAMFTLSLP